MAEKVTGGDKPAKKKKQDSPGIGHNLTEIKKKAGPAVAAIIKKITDMESDHGAWMSEIKEAYGDHAEKIGCSKKLLRKLVKQVRDAQKEEAELAEMEADEREQLETLQAALDGTPFGIYFADKLAASPAK
jgi:uncharacterized protein (UPF0335 family)